jgi:hypothetical protein
VTLRAETHRHGGDIDSIFRPWRLGSLCIPNRIVRSATEEGLSTEETAAALNLSIPAVKSRLLRARLRLREKLTRVFKRKGDDFFGYM